MIHGDIFENSGALSQSVQDSLYYSHMCNGRGCLCSVPTLDQHASSGILEGMKNARAASTFYPARFTSELS